MSFFNAPSIAAATAAAIPGNVLITTVCSAVLISLTESDTISILVGVTTFIGSGTEYTDVPLTDGTFISPSSLISHDTVA